MRQKYIWATMEIDSLFELHTYLWVGAATLNFCYRTQVMCAFLGVIMSQRDIGLGKKNVEIV